LRTDSGSEDVRILVALNWLPRLTGLLLSPGKYFIRLMCGDGRLARVRVGAPIRNVIFVTARFGENFVK
jgi:hypothetical protein